MLWQLILHGLGYLFAFVGCFIEGEITMMTSAYLASQGDLNFLAVAIIGWLGVLCADNWWFFVGKKFGTRFLDNHRSVQSRVRLVQRALEKNQLLVVFFYRYAWGFRTVTPLVLGTTTISRRRFFIYTLFTSALWATIFANLGYQFGSKLTAIIVYVRSVQLAVFTAIFLYAGYQAYNYFEASIKSNVRRSMDISVHVGKSVQQHLYEQTRRTHTHLKKLTRKR